MLVISIAIEKAAIWLASHISHPVKAHLFTPSARKRENRNFILVPGRGWILVQAARIHGLGVSTAPVHNHTPTWPELGRHERWII